MTKLKHTFKTDILFKMLFTKYPELLKKLVAQLLGIHHESIVQFEIKNPEMPPEIISSKFCRLDISMIVDGQQIDLEVQVENEGDFPERAMYYWARMYSSALPSGEQYSALPRTIVISILDFELYACEEFHSEYQALEVTRYTPMTDKMVFHFFELPKLPEEIDEDDMLLLWLALFKADTEEDLKQLNEMGVPELSDAINAYGSITASAEFQEIERMREKAAHDEAQALRNAEQRKALSIARNLLKMKMPIDQIITATGLTKDEVESLDSSN